VTEYGPVVRRGVVLAALVAGVTASAVPAATGIKVASGRYGHTSWTLLAETGRNGSYTITMVVGNRLSASEGGVLNLKGPLGITYLAHRGRPGPNYIVGPVISTATNVVITYANREQVMVPTLRAPTGLARNLRFYVHITRCRTIPPTRIVRVSAQGQIVASMPLPTRSGPRTTC